ncbi:MAG: hypothetical protein KGI27_06575 [Thaumarchaeota archaeon]|nr:hypothetical protein [Nitrososphaerota archaeon]
MWQIVRKNQFEKQYRLLGSERQKKADDAILDLAYSTNPATKGQYKSNIRVFAYELGRGDRCSMTYNTETMLLYCYESATTNQFMEKTEFCWLHYVTIEPQT